MKLLISAYACEPGFGSEPGVGWNWTMNLSKEFDEVHVVTRTGDRYHDAQGKKRVRDSRSQIESHLKQSPQAPKITFHYFDLPSWIANLERSLVGDFINIYLWEICVFFFMLKRFKRNSFDMAQKVTIVSHRYPSFVWYFAKAYIHGPIAGGERFPFKLLSIFSLGEKLKEVFRVACQYLPMLDPLVRLTLFKADKIIAVTPETRSILPKGIQRKCSIQQAINMDNFDVPVNERLKKGRSDGELKLLYVGRLLEWKGLQLAINALEIISDRLPVSLTVIGSGPAKSRFERSAREKDLKVDFIGFITRESLSEYYHTHDIFIFPSLRDSGGFVVLEAQAHDLPVICLDIGGPAYNLKNRRGEVLSVQNQTVKSLTKNIADKIEEISKEVREDLFKDIHLVKSR